MSLNSQLGLYLYLKNLHMYYTDNQKMIEHFQNDSGIFPDVQYEDNQTNIILECNFRNKLKIF